MLVGMSSRSQLTIETVKQFALAKQGRCLSTEFVHHRENLLFECELGHQWLAKWCNIRAGKWCPKCGILSIIQKKTTHYADEIERLKALAISRGGECLSDKFNGVDSKLDWRCAGNHPFSMTPKCVKAGRWCPTCNIGISERICRGVFETVFNCRFEKVKPDWLKLGQKSRLELDGYNHQLNIAFEYNGEGHYKRIPAFRNRMRPDYDLIKTELCKAHGTKLFVVPHPKLISTDMVEHIVAAIKQQAAELEVELPVNIDDIAFDKNRCYRYCRDIAELAKMREIVVGKGICLSDVYLGSDVKLPFSCNECGNERFELTPNHLKQGVWHSKCSWKRGSLKQKGRRKVKLQ
jgi:hypothetical protein